MGPPELCGAGQWLVGFLELSRSKIFKMEGAQIRRFAILKNPHFHYGSGQILDLGASCSQQSSKLGGSQGARGRSRAPQGLRGGVRGFRNRKNPSARAPDPPGGSPPPTPAKNTKRRQRFWGPHYISCGVARHCRPCLPGGCTLPHRSVETLGRGPRSKPRAPM